MAVTLPGFSSAGGAGQDRLRRVEEYLMTLNEALTYALSHISEENLTEDLVGLIGTAGTDNAATLGVTALQRTMAGLGLAVTQGSGQVTISLMSGDVTLDTKTVSLKQVREAAADLGAGRALEACWPVGAVFAGTGTDEDGLPPIGAWQRMEAQPLDGITLYERTE